MWCGGGGDGGLEGTEAFETPSNRLWEFLRTSHFKTRISLYLRALCLFSNFLSARFRSLPIISSTNTSSPRGRESIRISVPTFPEKNSCDQDLPPVTKTQFSQ